MEVDETEEGEEEEDETFARFQSQMQSLIAEGQAALTSEVNMEGIEDDEEEQRFKKMHSSNSFGNSSSNNGMPGGNLFGFDALSSSSSSSMNQPSSSSSNQFFNQQQQPSSSFSSTSQFNHNFSNPTSSFSPLPEPSKTSQFSSHHHHHNTPPQSSRFSQQAQNPQATFSFRSATMGVGNSSSSSPFGNPSLNQIGHSNNSFTPVSPSPLGSRESSSAPFVFGASNSNSSSSSSPVRNLGGNSPYARRPQGGSNSKSRTRNQQQPRWVG